MELTRFFRFIVTGLVANGLGLAIFQTLVWAGVAPEVASLLAFFPAVLAAYLLNKLWSFESTLPHGPVLLRYCLVTVAMMFLQAAIISVLYRLFGVWPLAAAIIALAIVTPVSFLLMTFWVFASGRDGQAAEETSNVSRPRP